MVAQSARADKWEERHKGALAASDVGRCLHCAAARLVELPKTKPFTPQQKRRMSVGAHFQSLERERLKGEGLDWYAGRVVKLEGLPIPVTAQPDFVVRENGSYRIIEVKYRTFPPPELPREWQYQAGVYSLRYESCPVTFALYDLEERQEFEMPGPPAELPGLLQEWTEALAGVLAGDYTPNDLPHEPYWCKRSEWACTDCIGQRTADSELSTLEQARLQDYLALRIRFEALRQAEKEYDAAQQAAKEILAAHGGTLQHSGLVLTLRESRSTRLDTKAIPPEVRKGLPTMPVVSRRIDVKEAEA